MVGFTLPPAGVLRLWNWLHSLLQRQLPRASEGRRPGAQTVSTRLNLARPTDAGVAMTEISGLTKTEAEDLLDWLEAHGDDRWELTAISGSGFGVRRK
jgi:hypothetical protein